MCYIDDILITGEADDSHLSNLAEVFKRLEKHGIQLTTDKCNFMWSSVVYFSNQIDADGLHAVPEKLEAVINAPGPKKNRSYAHY